MNTRDPYLLGAIGKDKSQSAISPALSSTTLRSHQMTSASCLAGLFRSTSCSIRVAIHSFGAKLEYLGPTTFEDQRV